MIHVENRKGAGRARLSQCLQRCGTRRLRGQRGAGNDQHRGAADKCRIEVLRTQLHVDCAVAIEHGLAIVAARLANRKAGAMLAAYRAATRSIHAKARKVPRTKRPTGSSDSGPKQRRGVALTR
jgi:hypothetical protein